jgi:hypothetical protein
VPAAIVIPSLEEEDIVKSVVVGTEAATAGTVQQRSARVKIHALRS